jgi:two-component system, chemotaxis family, protein-glutamate methylesterase/glutaminase
MSAAPVEAVVIGASAGAFEALSAILPKLPASFRPPVMVVVHMPQDRKSMMAELLQGRCRVKVREAEDKEPICGGTVYVAPPDYHLLVEMHGYLSLSSDDPILFSRPAIDVLFESAADAYGPGLIGIILTGANHDGANGMKAIVDAGGLAIVQRPEDAFAPAMPEAALAACPNARVLSLEEIATWLQTV